MKTQKKELLKVATVKSWVASLACSQGFYGRLYNQLDENGAWEAFTIELRKSNVNTMLDMVMVVEC